MPIPVVSDNVQFTGEKVLPIEGDAHTVSVPFAPGQTIEAGTVVAEITSASVNEVQTLNATGTVSGGTFTITLFGKTTAALAYNISNADLKIAIEDLLEEAGIVGGTVTIGGGALPTDATVTFGGTLAGFNVPLMSVEDALITGGGTLVAEETTPGRTLGSWVAYDDAGNNDGTRTARGVAQYSFTTDEAGRVSYADGTAGNEHGGKYDSAPIYTSGRFRTTDLTGLDANAVTDLGRLESGVLADGVLLITGS